jgi:hypothetical protein
MLQWLYMYVASVFSNVSAFHLDVAYVAVAIHICCKCLFQMFHPFQMYVASVFILMLHMLQWLYPFELNKS